MQDNKPNDRVLFYEKEYYFLSNFSAFAILWNDKLYPTSEHVYQSEKFDDDNIKEEIRNAGSARDAKQIAKRNNDKKSSDWVSIKVGIMKKILLAKVEQHPYIKEKLLESKDKEIIENSPEDSFWGWGPNKDGENHLGKLWMEIRAEFTDK
jgi:hypothetical protein